MTPDLYNLTITTPKRASARERRPSSRFEKPIRTTSATGEAATAAQERLDRAGYTGTQIVPAPH